MLNIHPLTIKLKDLSSWKKNVEENFQVQSNEEHYNSIHPIIKDKIKKIDEKINNIRNSFYASQDEEIIYNFSDLLEEFNEYVNRKLKPQNSLISLSTPFKVIFLTLN